MFYLGYESTVGGSFKSLVAAKVNAIHSPPAVHRSSISSQEAARLVRHDSLLVNPCCFQSSSFSRAQKYILRDLSQ